MSILLLFFYPILILVITITSLKFLIDFLKQKKILDTPKERSNHSNPMPRGAGFIIIPIITVSIFIYIYFDLLDLQPWISICFLTLVLFLTSSYDDLYNLPSSVRLGIQTICVIIALYSVDSEVLEFAKNIEKNISFFSNFTLLIILLKMFLILIWLWILNLFNFMDGMDGLTSSQVCTFSIGMIFLSVYTNFSIQFSYIGVILLAPFIGFFYWNKPPAKIFLGDSGSIPIGFLIGGVITFSLIKFKDFTPLIILILFHFFDSSLTLLIRLVKRKNIFKAHSEHFYQLKLRNGYTHSAVLRRINLVNFILIFFSLLYDKHSTLIVISSILMVVGLLFWLKIKRH